MAVDWLATYPDFAVGVLVAGVFGIYFELLRPGSVIPGALGGVAALLATAALLRNPHASPAAILIGLVVWIPVTVFLVRLAIRARRNKMGE